MGTILVVEDEAKMRHLLSIILGREGHDVIQARDGLDAVEKLEEQQVDMVITDIKMPRMDGTALLEWIRKEDLSVPVVFITAFATVESAVEAMRMGAADYITKPFEEERILLSVARTMTLSRVMAENRELRRALHLRAGSGTIVYQSEAMKQILAMAVKVAKSNSVVSIEGESGTGKELLARFIHEQSDRATKQFVAINCAAISPNLVESELFGHEKGAFTNADRRKQGKFEYASGGTLFLDEIAELSQEAQAKLLRALQERKIQRVGGNTEIDIDVRLICATNRNLETMVADGAFRQDLFFRINVFPIELVPLRERREDIEILSRYFISRFAGGRKVLLTEGAVGALQQYHWPGNIRELANVIERVLILEPEAGNINSRTLSFLGGGQLRENNCTFKMPPGGICIETLQNDLVAQALELADNNQSRAAKLLGLTRAKFRVLLKNAEK